MEVDRSATVETWWARVCGGTEEEGGKELVEAIARSRRQVSGLGQTGLEDEECLPLGHLFAFFISLLFIVRLLPVCPHPCASSLRFSHRARFSLRLPLPLLLPRLRGGPSLSPRSSPPTATTLW